MTEIWRRNIQTCQEIVRANAGPELVIVVSGSEADRVYWEQQSFHTRGDIFRHDGRTTIASVAEFIRKGNFLGTLNAFGQVREEQRRGGHDLPQLALMSMVFGKGKRLSPFTQALGDRKPAFPTPRWASNAASYLQMADFSNLYANLLLRHLREGGFHGLLIKWGDEAIIPGADWSGSLRNLDQFDVIRTVMSTPVTEELAREKDWLVIDPRTQTMRFELTRQEVGLLTARLAEFDNGACELRVNLGTSAVSYPFLEVAMRVLGDDVRDPRKWVDWDPYVWIALCCADETQWQAERRYEDLHGKTGIRDLERRYPDFFAKMTAFRLEFERTSGHPLRVGVIDLGRILWVDFGLHLALRKTLAALPDETEHSCLLRDIFAIPHERDERGNILVRSSIPADADIRDSVLIDTVVRDDASVVRQGIVIGGRHGTIHMPAGGSALFCAADRMTFDGPHGIAFRSIGEQIEIESGGRHTTLFLDEGLEPLVSNEEYLDYNGTNYSHPILGNRLSFEEASELMSQIGGRTIDERWLSAWRAWQS